MAYRAFLKMFGGH